MKKQKAFTLVELVVVFFIVVILFAMVAPPVSKRINQTRDSAVMSAFKERLIDPNDPDNPVVKKKLRDYMVAVDRFKSYLGKGLLHKATYKDGNAYIEFTKGLLAGYWFSEEEINRVMITEKKAVSLLILTATEIREERLKKIPPH